MSAIRSICVYCGSSPGNHPDYARAATILGTAIANAGLRLVYGGGTTGIMGTVSNAALEAGGEVIGIIPEFLLPKETSGHRKKPLTELIVTKDMHARKHILFEQSDAFVAMPGGIGTVEEIIEVMTWGQLGRHSKPMAFGNINGFWNPMITLINHMKSEGFIHTGHLVNPLVFDAADMIVPGILAAAKLQHNNVSQATIENL